MEKQIFKIIGKEIIDIIALNRLKKFAIVSAEKDGFTAFILLKMYSITKPLLNDSEDIPEKAWKYFFPLPVKVSDNIEYIQSVYDLLCI